MRSVGEIIKTARKEKGLKLDFVASETKIRREFLQAIENNQFDQFESKAVSRGLIKNYAEYLDLPSENILAVFNRDFIDNRKIVVNLNTSPGAYWTPKMTVAIVVVIVALLIMGYLVKQYLSLQSAPY